MNAFTTSRALITGACLLALATPALGQYSTDLRSGEWIRVETKHAGKLQGQLIELRSDSLILYAGTNASQRFAVRVKQ